MTPRRLAGAVLTVLGQLGLVYWILVGQPSWKAMKRQWRWLHEVHYRY